MKRGVHALGKVGTGRFGMTSTATSPPHKPLIAVVGATGTGKSQVCGTCIAYYYTKLTSTDSCQLAVELALKFNGEVMNSDALQLYEGLPIITNKITEDERKGVPHHLLGCVGLKQQTWRADIYVKKALDTVRSE